MSVCAKLIRYRQSTCQGVSGGIAKIYVFDPEDFNFTQAAPVSGVIQPYTAISATSGTPKIYEIKFQRNEAEYSFDQSSKGGYYTLYKHKVTATVPDISMRTVQWNTLIDLAGECCGIGLIIVLNSGRIIVMGEKYVNTTELPIPFFCYQDGSKASSGKKFDDENSNTVSLNGEYNRALIEFTGGTSALTTFVDTAS